MNVDRRDAITYLRARKIGIDDAKSPYSEEEKRLFFGWAVDALQSEVKRRQRSNSKKRKAKK